MFRTLRLRVGCAILALPALVSQGAWAGDGAAEVSRRTLREAEIGADGAQVLRTTPPPLLHDGRLWGPAGGPRRKTSAARRGEDSAALLPQGAVELPGPRAATPGGTAGDHQGLVRRAEPPPQRGLFGGLGEGPLPPPTLAPLVPPGSLLEFLPGPLGKIGGGGEEKKKGPTPIPLGQRLYGSLGLEPRPTSRDFVWSHPDFRTREASFYGWQSSNCVSRVFCMECREIPAHTCESGSAELTRKWPSDGGMVRRRAQQLNRATRRRDAEGAAYFADRLAISECEYWWVAEYTCVPYSGTKPPVITRPPKAGENVTVAAAMVNENGARSRGGFAPAAALMGFALGATHVSA